MLPTRSSKRPANAARDIATARAGPSTVGYHASKWALEGLTGSPAQEVSGLGIKVTLIEPGAYATDWDGESAVHSEPIPAYDGARRAEHGGAGRRRRGQALRSASDRPRIVMKQVNTLMSQGLGVRETGAVPVRPSPL